MKFIIDSENDNAEVFVVLAEEYHEGRCYPRVLAIRHTREMAQETMRAIAKQWKFDNNHDTFSRFDSLGDLIVLSVEQVCPFNQFDFKE